MTKKKTKRKFYKYFWLLHTYGNTTKSNFYWHSSTRSSGLVFCIYFWTQFLLFQWGLKLKFYASMRRKGKAFVPIPTKEKTFSSKIYEKLATRENIIQAKKEVTKVKVKNDSQSENTYFVLSDSFLKNNHFYQIFCFLLYINAKVR